MTDVYIRNLRLPTHLSPRCVSIHPITLREMMLAGRWTENSNNGDAAWASNILATAADFAVSVSNRQRVTCPSAPFVQAMADDGDFLTLLASNDQNRGVFKIVKFVDTQTVEVDLIGAPPEGWKTESGISGRIVGVYDNLLANGAWVLMDSPNPRSSLQLRLHRFSDSYAYAYARPKGKTFAGTGDAFLGTAPTMQLTDSAGDFTPGMVGRNITIAGSTTPGNDGVFTITGYVDATTVEYMNAAGVAEVFAGTWSVAGISAETTGKSFATYYQADGLFNGRFTDDAFVVNIVHRRDTVTNRGLFLLEVGDLDGVDPEDTDPGYVYGFFGASFYGAVTPNVYVYDTSATVEMLDINNNPIIGYVTHPKYHLQIGAASGWDTKLWLRTYAGKGLARRPWVVLDNTLLVGGCVRGKLRHTRWGNRNFETARPMDGAGTLIHMGAGLMMPRNGPNDPLPIIL